MKKTHKKLQFLSLLLVAGLLFSGLTISVKAFIQKPGTVNEAVTLRQNADSSSAQVMELSDGQSVTVNNELTGADGAKWYQVFVNGTTLGYVPVSTVTISGSTGTATTPNTDNSSGSTIPAVGGSITERVGTVTADSAVRVRKEATTSSEQVASMNPNDTFEVLSDVEASDGYVWHEIKFDDHGTEVHGYVRSDLVSVKEVVREEAPTVNVPPVSAPSDEQKDAPYSVVSQQNAEGTEVWYLKNNATGESKEIASLLTPQKAQSKNGVLIGAIVVLAILVIAAAGGATFFYMRWQDAEDFIDEIRDKQARARKQPQPMPQVRTAPEKSRQPVKPASKPAPVQSKPAPQPTAKPASQPMAKPAEKSVIPQPAKPSEKPVEKKAVQEELPKAKDIVNTAKKELQNKQTSAAAQPAKAWKSKNFLTEDDDLEFDFLDIEDK